MTFSGTYYHPELHHVESAPHHIKFAPARWCHTNILLKVPYFAVWQQITTVLVNGLIVIFKYLVREK